MVSGGRMLISIGYKYNVRKVLYFIVAEDAGGHKGSHSIFIYVYTPTIFIMFPFSLLLVPLSCISSLDLLMIFNPTTNQVSLI